MSIQATMDITNLHANQLADRRVKGGATSESAKDAGAKAAEVKDVELSDQARSIAQLVDSVAEQPAFDAERVADIQAAISEGRYHVDPERLAANFMNLENIINQ